VSRLPTRHPGEATRHYALRLGRMPLRRFGYDIEHVADPIRRETLEQAFQHLARVGPQPRTVIDVGVAAGTPELYRAFPHARYLLVEAVEENEEWLQEILEGLDGDYVIAAATAYGDSITLRVSPDRAEQWNSSIFRAKDETTERWVDREVPAVRIDDVVEERGLEGPFLIKADTEGSELEVLRGAERVLEQTTTVVLEVTLIDYFQGAPRFADVVGFMAERSFVPYDIVGGFDRPSDGALVAVDVVFVREP
jgi:FkbM family methyltransferase